MKILEFIEGYKNDKVINTQIKPNAVAEYLKEKLEIKNYVPFAEKRELCEKVLNACNTIKDNGLVEIDSVSRYILFTLSIIAKYTNFILKLTNTGVNPSSVIKFIQDQSMKEPSSLVFA
jgi:hypothetical protein